MQLCILLVSELHSPWYRFTLRHNLYQWRSQTVFHTTRISFPDKVDLKWECEIWDYCTRDVIGSPATSGFWLSVCFESSTCCCSTSCAWSGWASWTFLTSGKQWQDFNCLWVDSGWSLTTIQYNCMLLTFDLKLLKQASLVSFPRLTTQLSSTA